MQKYVWRVQGKGKNGKAKGTVDDLITQLLENRGIKTKAQRDDFLHPSLDKLFTGIPFPEMDKAVARIKKAIADEEKIAVYSDYDADGICATCIMWETIYGMGGKVEPYMPHRMTEGYGLAKGGIEALAEKGVTLIITVDNGITAVEQVEFAREKGIDVIITDHHQKPEKMPKPYALVWSDQICGTGVAFVLAKNLLGDFTDRKHLDVAALATVTDVMPLVGFNRAILREGLKELNYTRRVGLQALFSEAGLQDGKVTAWEIGHIIGPRLNAMGRLESAMDSLRLLCTNNPLKAKSWAMMLAKTNSERQKLTERMVDEAKLLYEDGMIIGVLSHEAWHEGVVGLVAGRMVEAHYRPMIAIARGHEFSKGSARSIPGFNIIEALRSLNGVFENVGGHPMAAGFTIRTEKIEALSMQLTKLAEQQCDDEVLCRKLSIDMELPLAGITFDFYKALEALSPFGNANPEPLFLTKKLTVAEIKKVGQTGRHAKLVVTQDSDDVDAPEIVDMRSYNTFLKPYLDAMGFGMGDLLTKVRPGDLVDIVYTIDLNVWNNLPKLQLKIKDIRLSN